MYAKKITCVSYLLAVCAVSLHFTAGDICFRKYVEKKDSCRGMMRKHFGSAEACCAKKKAAGYALKEIRNGRKFYKCTPCSLLNSRLGNEVSLPKKAGWSNWSEWSACSRTCEAGYQERTRVCHSEKCAGDDRQIQPCSLRSYCPVNGKWGPWYPWQKCSASCGGGHQVRRRQCSDPPPSHGGRYCRGSDSQKRECNTHGCPVDGQWGKWSAYSECSMTCGSGYQVRSRECDNPEPANGGKRCEGKYTEKRKCFDRACPVDGGWSLWSSWSQCSVSCDEGKVYRTRECDSPAPRFGGKMCSGAASEHKLCRVRRPCPVNGGWSDWSEWGNCYAKPCSGEVGYKIRSRSCTNPKPEYGGLYCKGSLIDRVSCFNNQSCPQDGGWCEWKELGSCSATCGQGLMRKERKCECPPQKNGGRECAGKAFDLVNCTTNITCSVHTPNKDKRSGSTGCGSGSGSGSGAGGDPDGSDVDCDQEKDNEGDDEDYDNAPEKEYDDYIDGGHFDDQRLTERFLDDSSYTDDNPTNVK